MPIGLEEFKTAYEKWVAESMPDFRAGKMTEIVKKYPFVVPDDIPWTPYTGNPSEQRFVLITSGGLYLKDRQPPFDTASIHGDPSVREIPRTVRREEIGIAHAQYDHSLADQDIDVIFPVHRLMEMQQEGIIGKLADTHYSCGYVNDVVPLVTETVPDMIARIKAEGVDAALLVPV